MKTNAIVPAAEPVHPPNLEAQGKTGDSKIEDTAALDVQADYKVEVLPLALIHIDDRVQARAALSAEVIEDYAGEMLEGANFPPLVVFQEGGGYLLADGFHRHLAARQAHVDNFPCEVRQGGLRDAVLFAAGANATHGLQRSNKDKRHAVLKLLRDEEWGQWTDKEIAKRCRVGHQLVGKVRVEYSQVTGRRTSDKRKYRTKHGGTAVMNTSKIGKANRKRRQKTEELQIKGGEQTNTLEATEETSQTEATGGTEQTVTAETESVGMPAAESEDHNTETVHPERQIGPDEAQNALIEFAKFVVARIGRKGKTFVVTISAEDAHEFHPLLTNAKLAIGE